MRDNPGISKFGDDAIRQVARSLARATGEDDDVATLERVLELFPEGGHVVVGNPEALRLAAELSHRIREHLGVRVVDSCRLHRLARSDDLVTGRENGDDRLPPDFDGGDADRGQDAGITAGQELTAAQHGLPAGDIRSGERHAASRCGGSGDPQPAAVDLRVLDHDDGIGATRNHPARGNFHGGARPNHRRWHDAGVNRFFAKLHGSRHFLGRTERVLGHDGKAIDIRAVERRHVNWRDDIGSQDAPERGVERYRVIPRGVRSRAARKRRSASSRSST